MILNIITPVTRPQNLPAIRESIRQSLGKGVDIRWWVIYDASCPMPADSWKDQLDEVENQARSTMKAIAGHAHRNTFLMQQELRARLESPQVLDEWVMSLDDDNILHPDLVPWMASHPSQLSNSTGVIWSQCLNDGIRHAHPDDVRVNHIDTAQFMFRPRILFGLRFNEQEYAADGLFIEDLYKRSSIGFLFVNQPLCYYNYLR